MKKICVMLISCDSAMNSDEPLGEFPDVTDSLRSAQEYPFLVEAIARLVWRLITA